MSDRDPLARDRQGLSEEDLALIGQDDPDEMADATNDPMVAADHAEPYVPPTDPPVAYGPAAGIDLKEITSEILAGYQAASKALQFTPTPPKQADAFSFENLEVVSGEGFVTELDGFGGRRGGHGG